MSPAGPQEGCGEIWYRLTPDDVIAEIGGDWARFAWENDAPELLDQPVGEALMDFVTGTSARALVRTLLARARSEGRVLDVPYRCDGPATRRFMRCRLEPGPDGEVTVRSLCVREEAREPVVLLDRGAERSDRFLRMCAWCARVEIEGHWHAVERAVALLDLFGSEPLPTLTHGICQECETRVVAGI